MSFGPPRALATLLAMAGGALAGELLAGSGPLRTAAVALGAGAGVALSFLPDALASRRLMTWLRSPLDVAPPVRRGFWGELAYRVERAVKERDLALAESQRRHEQLLHAMNASPNGLLLLDAGDAIVWCNRGAAEQYGLDPVRDLRQKVTNLVRHPAFVEQLQSRRFEQPVVMTSGVNPRTLSAMICPYGEGMKLVVSQDTTERERAESMRRDFVANVSHEIRTPLTVVAGFVETLRTVPLSDAERDQVLRRMAQQTTRMQRLVGDLLTLAQLEGSPRPGTDAWHDLGTLLRQVHAEGTALSAGRHTMRLVDGEPVAVAGSDAELHSAVGNLVSNAVRYTPDGGTVVVSHRLRRDGGLEIEVEDDGPGIAREHLPRLTERFYRVDNSRSRNTGGTGLGLSIVKHVMQRHGGSVEIDSELGRGTRFRLLLPPTRVRRQPRP